MIVYHGSTVEVRVPDVVHSKRFLDFGRGFYVTSYRLQAERWARRKWLRQSILAHCEPIVNEYELQEGFSDLKVLRFGMIDEAWFDFVCACRNGDEPAGDYDVVIGRVANDDVFKTIQKFQQGRITKQAAIDELRYAEPNDQISFLNADAVARGIHFIRAYRISPEE